VSLRPLSIVVPAKDEATRLPRLFETLSNGGLQAIESAGLDLQELLVVDDGSTDATAAIVLQHAARDPRIGLVRPEHGRGKGAAVRAGVLAATAPWVLVMDADLATPLDQAAALVERLEEGADAAIGSRGLPSSRIEVHQPRHRELAGKTFNALVRLVTGLPFRDTQCGFKLFRLSTTRPLFERQRVEGFAFDVEILVEARRRGLRVVEVPVRWVDDPDTKVRVLPASARMTWELFRITLLRGRHARGGGPRRVWDTTRQGGRAE
jgi:dolichyl-phosphate beta-glucosyltransferase